MKELSNSLAKVAVVQASPEVLNPEKGIEKIRSLSREASGAGARLVLFPESYIPFYPRNMILGTRIGHRSGSGRDSWNRIYGSSVAVPSDMTREMGAIAAENKIYLSVGITEKDKGTLYCTQLLFTPDGTLACRHRKIKPTAAERLLWGEGDAEGLTACESPMGVIGTLICWENYMPLARMSQYLQGVQIYLAPTADNRKNWQYTLRHIAMEGRCFVLAANQFVTQNMYPYDLLQSEGLEKTDTVISAGGSVVVSPFGETLAGPLYNREGILYADIDLSQTIRGKMDLDVAGHYHRPDIFHLKIDGLKGPKNSG